MVRVVLELRCVKCAVKFERTFEERRRQLNYSEGEMLQLDERACPNHCGGGWVSIEKHHPIRKVKRRFWQDAYPLPESPIIRPHLEKRRGGLDFAPTGPDVTVEVPYPR